MPDNDNDGPSRFQRERLERAAKFQEKAEAFKEIGIKLTKKGARRLTPEEVAPEKPEVFRISRKNLWEATPNLEVSNKDGSKMALMPMTQELRQILSGRLEIYVIGFQKPYGLEIFRVFVSSDPTNPWGT